MIVAPKNATYSSTDSGIVILRETSICCIASRAFPWSSTCECGFTRMTAPWTSEIAIAPWTLMKNPMRLTATVAPITIV